MRMCKFKSGQLYSLAVTCFYFTPSVSIWILANFHIGTLAHFQIITLSHYQNSLPWPTEYRTRMALKISDQNFLFLFKNRNGAAWFTVHDAFGNRAQDPGDFHIGIIADRLIAAAFNNNPLIGKFFRVYRLKIF